MRLQYDWMRELLPTDHVLRPGLYRFPVPVDFWDRTEMHGAASVVLRVAEHSPRTRVGSGWSGFSGWGWGGGYQRLHGGKWGMVFFGPKARRLSRVQVEHISWRRSRSYTRITAARCACGALATDLSAAGEPCCVEHAGRTGRCHCGRPAEVQQSEAMRCRVHADPQPGSKPPYWGRIMPQPERVRVMGRLARREMLNEAAPVEYDSAWEGWVNWRRAQIDHLAQAIERRQALEEQRREAVEARLQQALAVQQRRRKEQIEQRRQQAQRQRYSAGRPTQPAAWSRAPGILLVG